MEAASGVNRRPEKFEFLDTARGFASISVIFWHIVWGFTDLGALRPFWDGGILFTPLFIFINGEGAVGFFFVLSGFVLSLGLIKGGSFRNLLLAAVKRLPRLMIPCAVSILMGYVVLEFGGHWFVRAGEMSGSEWLRTFGRAHFPSGAFHPSLSTALAQMLKVFLLKDNFYYNSNLWTMRSEFIGSFLSFFIVLVAIYTKKFAPNIAMLGSIMVLSGVVFLKNSGFGQFMFGTALAYAYANFRQIFNFSKVQAFSVLAVSLAGFATLEPIFHTIASVCLIAALLGNASLSTSLTNRFGNYIGKLSFPLYLTHTLVILSAGSIIFVQLNLLKLDSLTSLILTSFAVIGLTWVASQPFLFIETLWVPRVSKISNAIVDRLYKIASRSR